MAAWPVITRRSIIYHRMGANSGKSHAVQRVITAQMDTIRFSADCIRTNRKTPPPTTDPEERGRPTSASDVTIDSDEPPGKKW